MRYFTYLAEQSFKTDGDGRRLFCLYGPLFRPYVIGDEATESRLLRKLTWFYRVFLTVVIVSGSLYVRRFHETPWHMAGVLGLLLAVGYVSLFALFFRDLRRIQRTREPFAMRAYFGNMARKHSTRGLWAGLIGCLVFVALGVLLAIVEGPIYLLCAAFFAFMAVAWGYALRLKCAERRSAPPMTADGPTDHRRDLG